MKIFLNSIHGHEVTKTRRKTIIKKIFVPFACRACPVAPEDGTGVGPEDRTGVSLWQKHQ
jgi:hypothetical protein